MSVQDHLISAMGSERGAVAADRLCEACVDVLDVDAVALSLIFEDSNSGTLGASSSLARRYDEFQFTFGEGPCLDTVRHQTPVLVPDLADPREMRWPAFRPAMLGHQIRSICAMPVVVGGQCAGALDLFRADPGPLDGEVLAGALIAAGLAKLPVYDIISDLAHGALAESADDAWRELASLGRAEVSQATGMVMAQLGVDPAEALVRLRAHAYLTGRTAIEVARDIVDRRLRLEAN